MHPHTQHHLLFGAPLPSGVFSRATWLRRGGTDASLRRALQSQRVERVSSGWFAVPDAHPEAKRAVLLGARVTCATALCLLGAWCLGHESVHLRTRLGGVARGTPRGERSEPGAVDAREVWHRLPRPSSQPLGRSAVDDLDAALTAAMRCLPVREFAMVADSAVNRNLVTVRRLRRLAEPLGGDALAKVSRVDGSCMSGTETSVRIWLQDRGHEVITQASFLGVGSVDLLVDGWLVIECDSKQFHDTPGQYRVDRRRDLTLMAIGPDVVRLTHRDVIVDWDLTWPVLATILDRGPRQPR